MRLRLKEVKNFEPYFFLFFGLFHLHRIWGIIDRKSYADFWLRIMSERGIFYWILMVVLLSLCLLGIITFFKNKRNNYWWRLIYLIGGIYLLFDLFAIIFKLDFWQKLILWMYDITSPYWNTLWLSFIIMGGLVFVLGIKLLKRSSH